MAQNDATTADENRDETKRFDRDLSADELIEGDRIDPALIPHSPKIDVGEPVARHQPQRYDAEDDRTFSVRLIVSRESRSYGDVQDALVYDPNADLFVRISGHTNSGAMNQKERDWKVRDIGREVVVDDVWDVEIPDLSDHETEREYVEEWVEILFDGLAHGDEYEEMQSFSGKTFELRDWEDREAKIQYHLETDE